MNINNEKIESSIFYIPLDKIVPNPFQPRISFDDSKLSALADSISRYGVLQPIVVTKKTKEDGEEYYELIAGERRFRASKIAGLKDIPAVVKIEEINDAEKFELAIIENLQREDLNPVDRASAFDKLVKDFNLTHGEIALRMGKSREYVSNSLRLLALPDEVLSALAGGKVSEAHARPLLMLRDRIFEQKELLQKIIKEKLTVRESERIARRVLSGDSIQKYRKRSNRNLKDLETKLAEKFGTKVHIKASDNGSGRVTIDFFSDNDLNNILNLVDVKNSDIEEEKYSEENEISGKSILSQEINSLDSKIEEKPVKEDEIHNFNSINKEEKEKEIEIKEVENIQEPVDGYDINFGAPKKEEIIETPIAEEVLEAPNENINNFSDTAEEIEDEIKKENEELRRKIASLEKLKNEKEQIKKELKLKEGLNNIISEKNTPKEKFQDLDMPQELKKEEIMENNSSVLDLKNLGETLKEIDNNLNIQEPKESSDKSREIAPAVVKEVEPLRPVDSIENDINSIDDDDAPGDSVYAEFLRSKKRAQEFKNNLEDNQKKESYSDNTDEFMTAFPSSHHSHIKNQTDLEAENLEKLRREALGLDQLSEEPVQNNIVENNNKIENIRMGSEFMSQSEKTDNSQAQPQNNVVQEDRDGLNNFSL